MMHKPAEHLRPGDILTRGFLVTTTPEVNDQHGVTATVVGQGATHRLSRMTGDLVPLAYDSATDLYAEAVA